ncbi:Crp/Fnr family transcriptional regulator [Telluribacter sp. SYSU D00476]|uniref:Crp/Fnr family transcriptional regulator n=1 Tax=Telluribacter sp. SYSU D00476 TaxID=2811430 RepID=UPI001FF39D72|nr:Crp/Fnr family transcriptional regulator [Telluribacter sp. SYSU D00476]
MKMNVAQHIPFSEQLHPDDWALAEGQFQQLVGSREDILVNQGQVCQRLYFIQEGLVYAQRPDGQILWYEAEGESFTELDSFYRQTPSQTIIKVAEADTRLICIHHKDLEALYAHSHRWALWALRFQQRELLRITHYYEALRNKDATQRYWELVEARPDILQRIPLGHIASYLGISQVSLSRIRAGTQKKQ